MSGTSGKEVTNELNQGVPGIITLPRSWSWALCSDRSHTQSKPRTLKLLHLKLNLDQYHFSHLSDGLVSMFFRAHDVTHSFLWSPRKVHCVCTLDALWGEVLNGVRCAVDSESRARNQLCCYRESCSVHIRKLAQCPPSGRRLRAQNSDSCLSNIFVHLGIR